MSAEAMRQPRHYQFVPGHGYVHRGPPAGPVMAFRAVAPGACEPPAGATDWSWHLLDPPAQYGGDPVKLQWRPGTKDWHPVLGRGTRVAFAASYLAAHGWTYNGPVGS